MLVSVVPMLLITQEEGYQNNSDPVYIEDSNYESHAPSSTPSQEYDDSEWDVASEDDFGEEGDYEAPA